MTKFNPILFGVAGLAVTLAAAAPASAQVYGQNNSGGVVGAIVNAVTGGGAYGQYPMGNYGYGQVDQRGSVQQCAAAAEQRLSGGYNGNGYQNGYGQQGYGQQGYGQQGGGRVLGVTSVERRSNGGLRVRGYATSGQYMQQGYGRQGYGRQGYGRGYQNNGQQADLTFDCKISKRGEIMNVNFQRNNGGYNRGY